MIHSGWGYALSINWDDRPGVLGFEVVFIAEQDAWSMSAFKHPTVQNENVHYYGIRRHEFRDNNSDLYYEAVGCMFSPTGYCQLHEGWPRYGEWSNLLNATDLAFNIYDILSHESLSINSEDAQVIWDACTQFWDKDSQKED